MSKKKLEPEGPKGAQSKTGGEVEDTSGLEIHRLIRKKRDLENRIISGVSAVFTVMLFQVGNTYLKQSSHWLSEPIGKVIDFYVPFAYFIMAVLVLRAVFPHVVSGENLRDVFGLLSSGPLKSEQPTGSYKIRELQSLVDKMERLAIRLDGNHLTLDVSTNKLLQEKLIDTIAASLSADAVRHISEAYNIQCVEGSIADTKTRLNDAVRTLGGRVNQNLWFGVMIAAIGIFALITFTMMIPQPDWGSKVSATPATELAESGMGQASRQLLYFLPRLSIVILIEVLAYFFLSLYRTGLDDLKYYQNELTNVEAREAAIHATLSKGNEDQVKEIVTALIQTDRNGSVSSGIKKRSKNQTDKDSRVALEALSKMESLAKAFQ